MFVKKHAVLAAWALTFSLCVHGVRGADWPMWRCDAGRSAATEQPLAAELHRQWVLELPRLKTAWPDQPTMAFDRAYDPVVAGTRLFVGSSRNDTVTAYDTQTGDRQWIFYADGPVRFAPLVSGGRLYFVSDDGYLYCLNTDNGQLVWKFRGGPKERKILGNERLISTWPARGAPVLADGTVYFSASIWPFMGIFLHALDAETGRVVWTNDGDGSRYIKQPHNAYSFASVAPQGPLVVSGDKLIVPGGRSVPAVYDRRTGRQLYYRLLTNAKRAGGSAVSAFGKYFFNGGYAFDLATGEVQGPVPSIAVPTADGLYVYAENRYKQIDFEIKEIEGTDRRGRKIVSKRWTTPERWSVAAPGGAALIKAGSRLYGGATGTLCAVDLPRDDQPPEVSWQTRIEGTPTTLLAAADRLFAVTLEGRIYCFGREPVPQPRTIASSPLARAPAEDPWTRQARAILAKTGVRSGYCIAWGIGTGRLITELLAQSDLHVITIDPDPDKVARMREQLIAAGWYGARASVHVGDPYTYPLPPYLASLMVSEAPATAGFRIDARCLAHVYRALRPYGGVACLPIRSSRVPQFEQAVDQAGLVNCRLQRSESRILMSRVGALAGSADWTHEHADAANSRVSKDTRVKAPLGILWFGGPSHDEVLPRHGHGPQPQVIDGRLLIEGPDMLRALDVYTGRLLWEARLPGVGAFFNHTSHEPGANASGTNFISTSDGIYVVYGEVCLRLDPATGRQTGKFKLPGPSGAKRSPEWGYINVIDDLLIGTGDPLTITAERSGRGPVADAMHIYDLIERKRRKIIPEHRDSINAVAFSPDSATLATASDDRTVKLWDVATGKARVTLPGHAGGVLSVTFSPDGKTLATGSEDKTARLWDLASNQVRATLQGHTGPVSSVAFSPDGKLLATGSHDKSIKLWKVRTGELVATLRGHTAEVNAVTFSPDGATLASGSEDKTARLWDVTARTLRRVYDAHSDHVNCVAFSPDGTILATGSCDRTTHLSDARSGKTLAILQSHGSDVNAVAFSPDGTMLASGGRDRKLILTNVKSRTPEVAVDEPTRVRTVAFAPDGSSLATGGEVSRTPATRFNHSSSKQLTVMNRHTGKVLWTATAESGYRHNAICAGGGRLYCIDRLPRPEIARLKRRGITPEAKPTLEAFDLRTGKKIWSRDENIFGTWLSYSVEHDVLVETGRVARDSLADEPKGMRAYKAADGTVLWSHDSYTGPTMIHGDTILRLGSACRLLTGEPVMREDPLTGASVPWTWSRTHGCNTPAASVNLLTFRSGAAGYFDLANDGGTGNFGGFRSSCSNNLIVADGVLSAPDYTRTCVCRYQNQTSVGLIYDPDTEMWTQFDVAPGRNIKHLAVNLGAPGDRRSEEGRLWLNEHERVKITFDIYGFFNGYSSKISGEGLPWVAASGCRGIRQLVLDPGLDQTAGGKRVPYTVRLHFADPDNDRPGRRVFDVSMQGRRVLKHFDIAKESGGRNKALVKEFKAVGIRDKLVIDFTGAADGADAASVPVLCGIEVVRAGE